MKLSVIITTHYDFDKLAQCLQSLYINNTKYKNEYEIIVVDNASDHADKIRQICTEINCKYIRSEENLSFSYANELGINISNGEWLLFLNDDTIPHQADTLKRVIDFAESKPKLGIEGIKLLFAIKDEIQHCGVVFNQDRQPIHHLIGDSLFDPRSTYQKQYQAVTGAFLLIKKSIYNEVGGFTHKGRTPAYYYEDIDLCFKVRQAGYEVWYNPDVVVYHHSASSFKNKKMTNAETFKYLPEFKEKWFDMIENDDYIHTQLPERNPIIMIGVPLSEGSKWIFPRLMNMIDGFHYNKKNIIIMLSMSNSGQTFVEEVMNYARLNGNKYLDFLVTTTCPHFEDKMKSVYYNREKIREVAIEKNVDYIFFIDSDVSMERTTLKRLVQLCEDDKCDISAGAYFYKQDENPKPMLFRTNIQTKEFLALGEKDKKDISTDLDEKASALGNFKLAKDMFDDGVHYAGATNMGCTLISKKCFDIPFTPQTHYGTEDLSWFAKAQEKNYRLMVDTSLKLFHLDQNGYVYCFWNLPMADNEYTYTLKPIKEKIA
jgi:GT2 family glycosyltransferase